VSSRGHDLAFADGVAEAQTAVEEVTVEQQCSLFTRNPPDGAHRPARGAESPGGPRRPANRLKAFTAAASVESVEPIEIDHRHPTHPDVLREHQLAQSFPVDEIDVRCR